MKRNISLLLGVIIGVVAASSLVQTYRSEYVEILNLLAAPIHLKLEIRKLKRDQEIGTFILDLQHSDVRQYDHLSTKFHITCFEK